MLIALGVVALVAIYAVMSFNALVSKRNQYKNAFSQIDVQLKRRHDLIPNLVETAKGYLQHEKETLQNVITARNAAGSALSSAGGGSAASIQALQGAESALSGALGRFMAVVERYPDLKANQTMSSLMEELSSTENRISYARQAYNDAVMSYNTTRESFPQNFIAGTFNFEAAALWALDNLAERQPVKVSFT